MKVLHLTYNEFVNTRKRWGSEFVDVCGIYKIGVKITKIFSLFPFLKSKLFMKLLFSEWKDRLNEYDSIILWADKTAPQLCEAIYDMAPQLRIIVYYVNLCKKDVDPKKFNRDICELWSFDPEECKYYDLKYNPPFTIYFNHLTTEEMVPIENDVYFLGRDKGRLKDLLTIKEEFERRDVKCLFRIVASRESIGKTKTDFSNLIPYSESIKEIRKSRAILDWNIDGQAGITQRPLEHIFLSKKLITNNNYIKYYDFYNKNNIFILGEDSLEDIKEFLNAPYYNVDEKIKNNYTVNAWLKRFEQ